MLNSNGELDPGVHPLTEQQFVATFCREGIRKSFAEAVRAIFSFANETHAQNILIGGSFVTAKETPNDIDVLITYQTDKDIPALAQDFLAYSINVDVLFCSYEHPDIYTSYLHLFGHDRNGRERGLVQVSIADTPATIELPKSYNLEQVKVIEHVYDDRTFVEKNPHRGILISIHGLYSKAEWSVEIAPIASSQGWIFAPYTYQGNTASLLFSKRKRTKTLDDFREWVFDVSRRYEKYTKNISIVAHSYGTYIVGCYLNGFM